ncbi:MAG: septum site-determining protein MinC [Candidatus Gastranaerophilales bacterium]|nr:septum site-determining protein MinC [Candidatus Gastranaerophilales bacterium]
MNDISTLEQGLLDLSGATTPANMLLDISNILDKNEFTNNRVKLVLGNISLTPAHICALKSILDGSEIEIEIIYTNSVHTQLAALGAGLAVSEQIFSEESQKSCEEEQVEEEYSTEQALEEVFNLETIDVKSSVEYKFETLYIKQTLRSGQTINFDGNVVIIGDCHPGSEIVVSGDISIWGVLGGIAHAGAKGDYNACIRALKINAIQLRIADLFARKPDKLEVEKNEKTNTFIPEEAKILNGEIIIYPFNG